MGHGITPPERREVTGKTESPRMEEKSREFTEKGSELYAKT
jgi:hypothetical protein